MLKFITNLFRKSGHRANDLASRSGPQFGVEASPPVPTVETAQLSLAAILAKFPDDLKPSIERTPDETVTVALPLPTILKQLPSGSVRMSLASVYRQAPAGVFRARAAEEKRMIEVPLAEIFKRVRPEALRRRPDQRRYYLPEEGFNLFGDKSNPYALSPTEPAAPEPTKSGPASCYEVPASTISGLRNGGPKSAGPHPAAPSSELTFKLATPDSQAASDPAESTPAEPKTQVPPLLVAIGELAANWPEPIKGEVAAMNGATVALPTDEVTAGLARGKVVFTWGAIRGWITPPPEAETEAEAATELQLPLRIVAPAFLKHSKRSDQRKKCADVDQNIPELFSGGDAVPKPEPPKEPAPVAEPVQESVEAAAVEVPPVAAPEPAVVAPSLEVAAPAEEPAQPTPATAPVPEALPQSIGEIFGQPEKSGWSPAEIVENVVKLPGIAGAAIALQEGLLVAHRLPEGLNGETFAAFLPQIFARLNQYAGEMNLGEVDELTLNTRGASCQLFRLGEVLFAALGKAGEPFPADALRLCAQELKK